MIYIPLLFPTNGNCGDCKVSSPNINDRLMRQYRACVIDSLGLGITCILYRCNVCTRHPDLVFAFYAIPIFYIIYLSPLIFKTVFNLLTILVQVCSNAKAVKKTRMDYSRHTVRYMYANACKGALLTNTVYTKQRQRLNWGAQSVSYAGGVAHRLRG